MLESLPIAVSVGVILGFLSGLGVGGGSLLILWLTLILHMDRESARSINLMFFIPSAVIATIFRWHQGSVRFRKILPAVVAGCISAAVFSFISKYADISLLKKLFGILLVFTGMRELFYRERAAR